MSQSGFLKTKYLEIVLWKDAYNNVVVSNAICSRSARRKQYWLGKEESTIISYERFYFKTQLVLNRKKLKPF